MKPIESTDLYFQLIAYPVYEWPTVSFELPGHCTEEVDLTALNPTGCSTCNGGCEGITRIGNAGVNLTL